MPKYLFQASYSVEGLRGLLKDGGTQRKEVVERLLAGMGGNLQAFSTTPSATATSRPLQTFPTRRRQPRLLSWLPLMAQ